MIYKIVTSYTPEDAVRKMSDRLGQMNAKIESITDRSIKARIKVGFMTTTSIQITLTETPYGSIIEFAIPNFFEEQLVDETFFGKEAATVSQTEKKEKIRLKIHELKASVDGLNEEEATNIINLRTNVKFLSECPHCGSSTRKGFRCAYCNRLMVKFE